ncbi:MAG TPA: ribbon-helix-helix domain-containing protein [Candidatus Nanoarchaeia archaeon]|nr:ribbon-helix-helix domain-containing protein [Candidatus Nanoarchaeia archaeon]
METISVRFEETFVRDIERAMKERRYATKTEFIREAIRDKLDSMDKEKGYAWLKRIYGMGKDKGRNITDADLRRAREGAMKEMEQRFGLE